jgi:hypothetical protein
VKCRNHDKIGTVGSIGHVAKDRHFADWRVKGMGFPNLSNSRYVKSKTFSAINSRFDLDRHFFWSIGYREMEGSRLETHHKNVRSVNH